MPSPRDSNSSGLVKKGSSLPFAWRRDLLADADALADLKAFLGEGEDAEGDDPAPEVVHGPWKGSDGDRS